ncbi:hypothetical protein ACFORJ_07105 [Corynebacterium hansenii]|uniref:Uncharacterized protein n=1 Tax=Corynebacterium hansenii TaxID=394964 RepID=A0ABV7ZRB9_9CORY|nr:hypothetical protein [Corynebacterium hansenii]WJZ00514.1 hypothetical protein CHAN_09555 [Corynebacterium hansenii]
MVGENRPGSAPGEGIGPVPGDAPGPWRVSGPPPAGGFPGRTGGKPGSGPDATSLYDAAGNLIAPDWRVTPSGLTGRSFTVSSPDDWWRARAVGLTVAHVVLSGPGGELSLNRRDGGRGREIVDVGERRLVARTKLDRGLVVVEIVGGSPDAAGVDAGLLAAAAFACAHLDGPARLMG